MTTYADATAANSEAQGYASAVLYASGDATHATHIDGVGYLAVQETVSDVASAYVFASDYTAVAFVGASLSSFQASAIAGG